MTDKEKTGFLKLREIDVNKHVEKKNGFSYLSWAWALDVLMQNDPEAKWEYPAEKTFPDGTVMVYCTVTAFGKEKTGHLPVMDYKNQPIKNPNAFQTNTAMQRCFVKAVALHGLGLYLYAGEDLPEGQKSEEKAEVKWTREDKMNQRDILYALGHVTNPGEYASWLDAHEPLISSLPEAMVDLVSDATDSKQAQLSSGKLSPPPPYGFVDVEEANFYFEKAKEYIGKSTDIKKLAAWISDKDPKLKALDTMLKAAKYQTGDSGPYQQVCKIYQAKIEELK